MFTKIAGAFLSILVLVAPANLSAEWHEASSEHFLVIADQKEKDVREFTERLERYHSALLGLIGRASEKPSPSNRVMSSKARVRSRNWLAIKAAGCRAFTSHARVAPWRSPRARRT